MTSFLDDIITNVPITLSTDSPIPLALPLQQDSPARLECDSSSESEMSQHGDEDRETPAQTSTQAPPDAVASFTINTARNLRLTAGGESSLLHFSQLDMRLALIYQQATLIKLSEMNSRLEAVATAQASGARDEQVLTNKIKDDIDYRVRLVIVSPGLSRYRAVRKDMQTGPGAIVLKWFRSKSGINKKYLQGDLHKAFQSRIKVELRYARAEVKDVIRRSVEEKLHITGLLEELAKTFEKWFKSDLRTPMAIAVRFALLRQIYNKDSSDSFWVSVDKTLADIRKKAASNDGLSASQILVKFLDADEEKYPPAAGSTSACTSLATVQDSEDQLSMDAFISTSDTLLE